jgi:biopolymer transport protein ExbD
MRFTPQGRRLHNEARMNITPMIDVVFLLLIFFLTTTTFLDPESLLSPLIRTSEESAQAAYLQPQVVRVAKVAGEIRYVVGDQRLRTQTELTAVIRALPKEPGIYIEVTGEASVDHAAAALQAARDAGFEKVTYVPAR